MVIETDARRFIVDAIDTELKLSNIEKNLKKKGLIFIYNNKEYNDMREKFIKKVNEINSVANN